MGEPDPLLLDSLTAGQPDREIVRSAITDQGDRALLLRRAGSGDILGYIAYRSLTTSQLFTALGDTELANRIRLRAAGKTLLITALAAGGNQRFKDYHQLLLCELLARALEEGCIYGLFCPHDGRVDSPLEDVLLRTGFLAREAGRPIWETDMHAPATLIQNLETTIQEPLAQNPRVLAAIRRSHQSLQRALARLYPGSLLLTLSADIIHQRLLEKITAYNNVPAVPTTPRVLGENMCVPYGKLLRGKTVPNTVTKTIHTDKVFAPDLHSFSIAPFPGYAPLESQIRTIHSFRRPVMLVDDLLHTGNRMGVLDPLFRREKLDIDLCVVGLLSGRGRDLMAARGRKVESVYFVPDLRAWFVESTMYPFIGGDAVDKAAPSVPGLTPAVNLILPYAFPRFYSQCEREAVFRFSRTCMENSRDILLALERAYRERYSRNLTLSRLSEAVILPLSPDKGAAMRYDPNLSASICLESDLRQLDRMRELLR